MNGASDTRHPRLKGFVLIPLAVAMIVALAGCGSSESPAAATDDGGAQKDASTEPASSGSEQATTSEAAAEPSGPVHLAFSSATPQVEKVPTIMAMDALKAEGFDTSILYLQKSEDPVAAVTRGDANFASASASAVFTAIAKGAPIVAVMQANAPNYALVAPTDVSDPGGLDGLRVGIHAKVSSTTLYTQVALSDYPDAKPKILVVPGSAKRIEALAADELDASVVQLADLPKLDEVAPGKFHDIYNFAQKNPELIDSVIFVAKDTLATNPQLVQDFIAAHLKANQAAYDDVQALGDKITELVPDTSADLGQQLAKLYTDAGLWPRDGGLTDDGVKATITALADNQIIEDAPDPSAVYDRSALDAVLAKQS